jgi:CheY-like chemotaxis protein
MKILVADDEEAIRTMFSEWLEMEGHQVITAKDGLEGIMVFNDQKPDLVITDFHMPNVNGATLTHHVKSQYPGIPVIMFTGRAERFSRAEAERIGASAYIPKPVTLERLKQAIDDCAAICRMDTTPTL